MPPTTTWVSWHSTCACRSRPCPGWPSASAGWRFDRLRVAGSLDVLLSQSDQFAVGSAIEQSLKVGKVDASTLLVETKSAAVGPGVQAAYGFHSTFGAFGHLRLEFANETVGAKALGSTTLNTGAAFSADLLPSTTTHSLTGGVFYTGRPDLSLGLEGSPPSRPGTRTM
jgi:hypothetical protein